ncbi:hypothetical protein D3C87_1990900 [compost metagenome]
MAILSQPVKNLLGNVLDNNLFAAQALNKVKFLFVCHLVKQVVRAETDLSVFEFDLHFCIPRFGEADYGLAAKQVKRYSWNFLPHFSYTIAIGCIPPRL